MAISVKKLDEKDKVSRFLVKGVGPSFLNAVRRSVMLHVPCLGIENISVYENDSVVFDDYLAHRLGMLPIKTDKKGYKKGDKVKMVLEKEGPAVVYSKDIKSTDPKIEIMDKNIPIAKLRKGQRIKLEMEAVMGSGKEHSKWQPAIIAYQEVPQLIIERGCNLCGDCVNACGRKLLEVKARKVAMRNQLECNLCAACRDACKKDLLKIGFDKHSFILSIEPIAGLNTKEVIDSAVEELLLKSKLMHKALAKVS